MKSQKNIYLFINLVQLLVTCDVYYTEAVYLPNDQFMFIFTM